MLIFKIRLRATLDFETHEDKWSIYVDDKKCDNLREVSFIDSISFDVDVCI